MNQLSATDLITHLGSTIRVDRVLDGRISLFCPFHKGGQERKASMSIYLDSGFVVCFTCGYRKPLSAFLVDRGLSKETAHRYGQMIQQSKPREIAVIPREFDLAAWVGTFRKYFPKNLIDAGFKPETLDYFQVGYDTRYRRVTYPIWDKYGSLTAIVGGAVDEDDHPKYKLYEEEINVPKGDARRHRDHLWGFHLMPGTGTCVVVEGYKACMAVVQAGIRNVCATQGTSFTPAQVKVLAESYRPVKIFYDNDPPGIEAAAKLHRALLQGTVPRVERIQYPRDDAKQPDWLTPEELRQLLMEE